jgi:lauroyl/myristoyl acyltransferase
MIAHFEMCYMITKFTKKMLRATGRPIRNRKINTRFLVYRKSCKEEKVPRKNQCLHDLIMSAI